MPLKVNYLVFILLVDIVISGALTFAFELHGDVAMVAMLGVVMLCVIISFIVKAINKSLLIYANINIVAAPLILFGFIFISIAHRSRSEFEVKRFSKGAAKYQMNINKIHKTYSINKVLDEDYTHFNGMLNGKALFTNDTVYLLGSENDHRIFIYKDILFGFPGLKDRIILADE